MGKGRLRIPTTGEKAKMELYYCSSGNRLRASIIGRIIGGNNELEVTLEIMALIYGNMIWTA